MSQSKTILFSCAFHEQFYLGYHYFFTGLFSYSYSCVTTPSVLTKTAELRRKKKCKSSFVKNEKPFWDRGGLNCYCTSFRSFRGGKL